MSTTLEVRFGVSTERSEARTREPVMALHCAMAGSGEWRRLGNALGPACELIAPSFYECGSAGPWPGGRAFGLADEASRIIAILDGLGGPVHLVGHSYGGSVALEVACARPHRVASLALYEPSSFHLLRQLGGRAAAELGEIEAVAGAIRSAWVTSAYQTAAAALVDFWMGPGTWESLWPGARERIVAWLPKDALDFLALLAHETPGVAYGRIRCPVRIVQGEHARAPFRLIAEELVRLLPLSTLEVLPGAGHMGPLTHPGEVNRLTVGFIRANPARTASHLSQEPLAA